ncbi:hypothetical protein FKW77_007534 [Venturia effusa]|uniref:Extracellular membrane protein CFEM domain-containing protein n=1 Tax=Venturia effusa TaxID=50376 RepID=A0A517LHK8_9PEZI|nr:hypothetical protein FKW77_007534 [Venturia effusa]
MKFASALALVLTPLLVVADGGWHFETQKGRADGTGTKRCQKFYMARQENFSFKLDHVKGNKPRSMRIERAAEPHEPGKNANGPPPTAKPSDGGSNNNNNNNNNNKDNSSSSKPQPKAPPKNGNSGQGNGSAQPGAPPKCCLKVYTEDECKDLDSEVCVEDKSEDRRLAKGRAMRDLRSFTISCTPDPRAG